MLVPGTDLFTDASLYFNYTKDWVLNAKAGSACKKEQDIFVLSILYKVTYHTQDKRLIQNYSSAYKCSVERENQSIADEKLDLWEHFKQGLTLVSNAISGGDINTLNVLLTSVKWKSTIDDCYNEIINA
jgi:hypothetical protein